MSRNNDVYQVLVTKGDLAPLVAGEKLSQLTPGQIGVFDFNTNLSVGAGDTPKNFYLAVGLDPYNTGTLTDVLKSRGSHIQAKNSVFYSYRPHTPGQPMKVVLKDYTANCETEYGIKLELRNQEIYRTQGYNQFSKTYSITTSCCDGCTPTCPSGDANEITKLLKSSINNDNTGLVIANAIPRGSVAAAGVTPDADGYIDDAGIDAIMAYNATQTDPANFVYTDLEITTVTQKIKAFCDVNLEYFYPRETVAIVTKLTGELASGFNCTGEVEVTQQAVFEEGAAYDVKQKEYHAKGWDESKYRVSNLYGLADPKIYLTVDGEVYDQISLTYDQFSVGAWEEYLSNGATCIAIPAADTVTRDGLLAILDGIITPQGFDTLADDALAADTDPTIIEKTEDKTEDTDGVA